MVCFESFDEVVDFLFLWCWFIVFECDFYCFGDFEFVFLVFVEEFYEFFDVEMGFEELGVVMVVGVDLGGVVYGLVLEVV